MRFTISGHMSGLCNCERNYLIIHYVCTEIMIERNLKQHGNVSQCAPLTYQPWESFGASPSSRTWYPKCYRSLWGRLDILPFEAKFHVLLTLFDPFFEDHKMMQWNGRSKSAKDIPSKKSRAINQLNIVFVRAIILWKAFGGFLRVHKVFKKAANSWFH